MFRHTNGNASLIHNTSNIVLQGGVDYTTGEGRDTVTFVLLGSVWHEIARSDNTA